jgi:hypothetical protein
VTAEVAKIKNAKIVLRNDTIANWEESTLILAKGEPAISFDEEGVAKLKIGDGKSIWSQLPFITSNAEGGDIVIPEDIQEQMDALNALVSGFDTRIQNAEADVGAAVLAAESADANVEELRIEMAAFATEQNAA